MDVFLEGHPDITDIGLLKKVEGEYNVSATKQRLMVHLQSKDHVSTTSTRKLSSFFTATVSNSIPLEIISSESDEEPFYQEDNNIYCSNSKATQSEYTEPEKDSTSTQSESKEYSDFGSQAYPTSVILEVLGSIFGVEYMDEEAVERLKSFTFLCNVIKNICQRKSPHNPHHPHVKSMVLRWSIIGNTATVMEISDAFGGPSRATIYRSTRPKIPVLDHVHKPNLIDHAKQFKKELVFRLPAGVNPDDVPCIIATDATAVTGRISVTKSGPKVCDVYGVDHAYNQSVRMNIYSDSEQPPITSTPKKVTVNGLMNSTELFEKGNLTRAKQHNAFILVLVININRRISRLVTCAGHVTLHITCLRQVMCLLLIYTIIFSEMLAGY